MPVSLKIDLKGLPQMRNLLRNYAQAIGGGRAELHMRFGIQALNWINENFRAQGGLLVTGPWAKLRPNTVAGRRRGSSLILQDTGAAGLKGSYQMNFDSQKAVVGSADPKALWHGKGTKGPYDIYPRNAKALAFPAAGPFSSVATKKLRTSKVKFSFSSIATRRTYRAGQNFILAKHVVHPGLPARRMLPIERELLPRLLRTSINFLKEKGHL